MIFKRYYSIFTGLIVFIIYLFTIAPSVIQIDSGELAAVQATLGIAHPTGYPLFSILGYLFQIIPLPFSKIFILNLLAALWCSIGVAFFTASAKVILDNLEVFNSKRTNNNNSKRKQSRIRKSPLQEISKKLPINLSEEKKILSAAAGGFVLAFSKTFWFQSTSVEVYSLHILLISMIIYFLIKSLIYTNESLKYSVMLSIIVALGFANHMTVVLLLPGMAYLYFNKYGFNSSSLKKAGLLFSITIAVVFIIYIYLPIRASQNPSINWGNPVDFERILRHVSGKQYQVWIFSSTESAKKQLAYFFNNLHSEFAIVGLLFCIVGIFNSFILAKKIFIFLILCFFTTLFYSINYDINDIDSYFLLSYISLSYFAVFGIVKIFSILKSKENSYKLPAAAVLVLVVLQIYINFSKVDQSDVYTFEDYTKALIQSTEKNSVIFSYQWDYFISESYYYQHVENFRKDVAIVDKELLRRSWYYNQLQTNFPGLAGQIKEESALFINAVLPFERSDNFNPNLLETLYRNIMTNMVSKTMENNRTFYIAPELVENEMQKQEFTLPRGYEIVPDLFLFKVVNHKKYVRANPPDFKIRFPKNRNKYINFIENMVGSMLVRRAMYELQFNKTERAKLYINKIKRDLPNYHIPHNLGEVIN